MKQTRRETMFAGAFQATPLPMALLDRELRYLEVNVAFLARCGRPREELLGRDHLGVFPADADRHVFERIIATGKPDTTPGGSTIDPLHGEDGEVSALLVCLAAPGDAGKLAAEALRRSEELNRRIIESSYDCIKVLDLDGRILSMSPGGQRLLEIHDLSTVMNVPWVSFWKGSDNESAVDAVNAGRAGGTGRFQGFCPTALGTPKWWDIVVTAIVDADGQPERLLAISRDITERRRAEDALRESEARFRTMADGSPLMIWMTNGQGKVEFVNRAFCDFFGTTLERIQAGGWRLQVHREDRKLYREIQSALRARRPLRAQVRVRRADGEWRWVDLFGQPRLSASGEFLGMVGSSPDITDQKAAEVALHEAARRKDEFLAVLSHELRNPLTPIRNSLYVLERVEAGSPQSRKAEAVIRRQVGHLASLIDDLLDVTRIARGKIHLQLRRLDLAELLRRTVEDHRATFQTADVALEVAIAGEPAWVSGDPTRLSQVVGNLLANAAKFTRPGGRVAVSLDVQEGAAVLCVRDTGMGIPGGMLERIFEPFAQSEQALDRRLGGLGLGLALARGLIELHGGRVTAASDGRDRGAAFTVTLPLEARAPATARVAATATAAPPRRRVLVIEDNVDAASSLQEALLLDQHEVVVAYSGAEGLAVAREIRPEVVLCDIGLPVMDGYEVARRLRAEEALRGTFLVALTGYARSEDIARAAAAGFDRHLAKPPTIEMLEQVIAEAGRVATWTGTDPRSKLRLSSSQEDGIAVVGASGPGDPASREG